MVSDLVMLLLGTVLGGALVLFWDSTRRLRALDDNMTWAKTEWEENFENDDRDIRERLIWADLNLAYRDGWGDGFDLTTNGPRRIRSLEDPTDG